MEVLTHSTGVKTTKKPQKPPQNKTKTPTKNPAQNKTKNHTPPPTKNQPYLSYEQSLNDLCVEPGAGSQSILLEAAASYTFNFLPSWDLRASAALKIGSVRKATCWHHVNV